jgi:hypothetical protein
MSNTPENKVKESIKTYLEQLKPTMFYFSVPASPFGKAGISDIICSFNGEFLAIEIKSEEAYTQEGHNLSVSQLIFKKLVENSGGIWVCVCSVSSLKEELLKVFPDEFGEKVLIKTKP